MLALLLHRGRDREVLLAVRDGEVVGHGMYTAVPGLEGVAELAVVVADAWQRRGLGQRLASALLAAASERGFREVGFTVLTENRPAVRLVMRVWPHARPQLGQGMYEYRVPLTQPAAA